VEEIERLIDGKGHHPQQVREAIHYGAPIPHCFIANSSNGCMAGFVHATIDPWGNLRPCPHVRERAGNVLEQDFEEVWHSPTMQSWREQLLAQCDGCSHTDECRSGCLAQAKWEGNGRDPLVCL
jgi:radical SAM protein with 4Fe4S-binding SPASM domain